MILYKTYLQENLLKQPLEKLSLKVINLQDIAVEVEQSI